MLLSKNKHRHTCCKHRNYCKCLFTCTCTGDFCCNSLPFFSIVQICNLTIAHVNCCCNLMQFLAIFRTWYYSGRRSGLMVSALDSGLNGPGMSPGWGALRCVLGQYTLLLQCLSPPRCINGYRRIYCWG